MKPHTTAALIICFLGGLCLAFPHHNVSNVSPSQSNPPQPPSPSKSTQHGSQSTQGIHYADDPAELEVSVDKTGLTVWIQNQQIYSLHNKTKHWAGEMRRYHGGIHVLALHERTLAVMQRAQFLTWQPAAHRMLTRMLTALQIGRIIVMIGVPEFVAWLKDDALVAMSVLGSELGTMSTRGEAWVFVARKGHHPICESLITSRNSSSRYVSPLIFHATIPRFKERICKWHSDPSMADRVKFCDTYEGYHKFCYCYKPIYISPQMAPPLVLREVIPVALVTATRLPMVLQQVWQLWQNPGGRDTPITIIVDGHNPEAIHLGKVLNITVVVHNNTAPKGTKERVNEHIKFALETIFKVHPDADKAILLEDDLTLAPDIIGYFQQTSLLMHLDSTVMFVNAYNYNSFPHTANDPSRIYRVLSYPYYGWMTRRKDAQILLSDWAPSDMDADWDLYIRKYHVNRHHQVIIPEIPRTKHEGGGGVHVSGYEQEVTFEQRPINKLPNVTINMLRHWDFAYAIDHMHKIENGIVVNITQHPCDHKPIPKYKNDTYVIYIDLSSEKDFETPYNVLGKCMGFYYTVLYETYMGTFSLKFFETPFIIVTCPYSPYCTRVPEGALYSATAKDLEYASKHNWKHIHDLVEVSWRAPAKNPEEEFLLDNIEVSWVTVVE